MSPYDETRIDPPRERSSRIAWLLLILAVVAGSAVAGALFRRLDRSRAEVASVSARLAAAQEKLAAEQASRSQVERQRERLETEKNELLTSRAELSRSVEAKDEELAKLKGTYDELQEKMKAEIAKGDVRLSSAAGRLTVDLVDRVLFDSGEARISRRGEEVLSRVGSILARVDDRQIQVCGHTDDAPISPRLAAVYPTNWELSVARATNVVRFLAEKAAVPAGHLVASGYGPHRPVASNATPAGRARNRRIEILLTPMLEPAAAKSDARPVAKAELPKTARGKRPKAP